ncbi:hypothetical protein ALC60_12839 [Trachymyrmex zeteki]|uniref:Uncharacterized protein n=1 Tax=Mycetomoellerius zeteki TaxID=64791 RepID=A0A151WJZ1_9HYME|nr:hypothetical protein ALC60_12839 [Trachymyrmex zeteki]
MGKRGANSGRGHENHGKAKNKRRINSRATEAATRGKKREKNIYLEYTLRGCARTNVEKVTASFCSHRARLADVQSTVVCKLRLLGLSDREYGGKPALPAREEDKGRGGLTEKPPAAEFILCRQSARKAHSQRREKVHEKERRETSDRNEVGRGGYRRKKHKDTTASVLAGCNAKEKSSALEKPTCGTLSPETISEIPIDRHIERTERKTYVY